MLVAGLALAAAFLLGVAAPYLFDVPDRVYLTERIAFRPARQPLLNGLFYALNLAVLEVAVLLGGGITALLWRARLLFPAVAVAMLLSGATGAVLAVFGRVVGFSPDQRGGMAIVAVTLGGMGGMMCFAMLKDRLRRRRRDEGLTGSDSDGATSRRRA